MDTVTIAGWSNMHHEDLKSFALLAFKEIAILAIKKCISSSVKFYLRSFLFESYTEGNLNGTRQV